jgi:hypothetical protein
MMRTLVEVFNVEHHSIEHHLDNLDAYIEACEERPTKTELKKMKADAHGIFKAARRFENHIDLRLKEKR